MKMIAKEGSKIDSATRPRRGLRVVVGNLSTIQWLSQIQIETALPAHARKAGIRIDRFVHALRFTREGRIFALLRVDDEGLLFRRWSVDGRHEDFCQVALEFARSLVKQSINKACEQSAP